MSETADNAEAPSGADRVLIVEDDEPVAAMFSRALERAGFETEVVSSVEAALESMGRLLPDFLSLDIALPGRSGLDLLRVIKRDKLLAKIPVVIVTGHAGDAQGEGGLRDFVRDPHKSGPVILLEKPVEPSVYVNAISRTLAVEKTQEHEPRPTLLKQIEDVLIDATPNAVRHVD